MRHSVDFTPQFDPDGPMTILKRQYNHSLENLYDSYEGLLQAIQDEQDARQRVIDAATSIADYASEGDIGGISNSISDVENELSDLGNAIDEIDMYEGDIVRDTESLKKIEKRLKFRPTVRPKMCREFDKLVQEARDF